MSIQRRAQTKKNQDAVTWEQPTKNWHTFGDGIAVFMPSRPVSIQRDGQWVKAIPTVPEVMARGNRKSWTCKASGQKFATYVWFRGMYEGQPATETTPKREPFVVDTHPKIWAKQNPLGTKKVLKVELTPEEQAAIAAFGKAA